MSSVQSTSSGSNLTKSQIGQALAIGAVVVGINYLLDRWRNQRNIPINDASKHITRREQIQSSNILKPKLRQRQSRDGTKRQKWGNFKLAEAQQNIRNDDLLEQLRLMTGALYEVERVNNLIVDMQLENVTTYPCPLVAKTPKLRFGEPFLMPEALVRPGQFVIQNCVFKAGQSIQCEKKYLRGGPRATQFFDPKEVIVGVVCLGQVCPGINTVTRELTLTLLRAYGVRKVYGIKYSFKGAEDNIFLELSEEIVRKIHHFGGCFLGESSSSLLNTDLNRVLEVLQQKGVNQLYIVGANQALASANRLIAEIRNRKLKIGVCVILKGINRNFPIIDVAFGFESAVDQAQRVIEQAYSMAKANFNGITILKVPGMRSGHLAMEACRAARNVNICLVPEFKIDLYGEKGLLKYLTDRMTIRGSCLLVYSEGASFAFRDFVKPAQTSEKQWIQEFPELFKKEIGFHLLKHDLKAFKIVSYDATQLVKCRPPSSLDTKLCCQIAYTSIYGLMSGYTSFVAGHLSNRVAMIPISQMLSRENSHLLTPSDEQWQRLLASTGQPSFINDEEEIINQQ